jgi:catechol 2,3-dioxygenase-like lactoylglutathione lyase family enzyme
MPWSILDYDGGGIARPGPDHIGFRVESLKGVKERLQTVGDDNPHLRPFPLGAGPEGQARLALFERCPYGAHHLADPDGVLLDIAEK